MPLQNHFTEPLSQTRPWEGFHSAWATMIAQELNRILPSEYVAIPQTSRGPQVEIDVATLAIAKEAIETSGSNWTPKKPGVDVTFDWPERDLFEVRILDTTDNPKLVGAIELVSPANKDRPATRKTFAGKCTGYLRQQVGLVVVDVVTNRHYDLHRELLELLELDSPLQNWLPDIPPLYAVAYRTLVGEQSRLELWPEVLHLGAELPTLPLWIAPELAVPVNLEVSYAATCEMLRIDSI